MPELPEAEVTAMQLRSRLIGRRLADIWVGRADIVREGIDRVGWYRGSVIRAVGRQGKSVIVEMEQEAVKLVELIQGERK